MTDAQPQTNLLELLTPILVEVASLDPGTRTSDEQTTELKQETPK